MGKYEKLMRPCVICLLLLLAVTSKAQVLENVLANPHFDTSIQLKTAKASIGVSKRTEIEHFFLTARQQLAPLLDSTARLNLLDYAAAGQEAQVENLFGGMTRLDTLAADYLKLQLTSVSTWELLLVKSPLGK